MKPKMIAGLGNPGDRYRRTRHNAGFMVLDALAREAGIGWEKKRRLKSWLGKGEWRGRELILIKPVTFVNLSGEAVRRALNYYRIAPGWLLVVVDDVNLEPGRIRLRRSGGPGGHHGLESIAAALGSEDFARLRLGVGGGGRQELSDYVLSPPGGEDEARFREAVGRAVAAIGVVIGEGLEAAMNSYNRPESCY